MKLVFSINNETIRIVFQDISLQEIERIKNTIVNSYNVKIEDIEVTYHIESEFDKCEFYIDNQGVLRLQGTVFNKQIDGIRASLDIYGKKSHFDKFLDEHKGDVLKILSPLLVTEERPEGKNNWKAGEGRELFDTDF